MAATTVTTEELKILKEAIRKEKEKAEDLYKFWSSAYDVFEHFPAFVENPEKLTPDQIEDVVPLAKNLVNQLDRIIKIYQEYQGKSR